LCAGSGWSPDNLVTGVFATLCEPVFADGRDTTTTKSNSATTTLSSMVDEDVVDVDSIPASDEVDFS
jgi:hypothetical protein